MRRICTRYTLVQVSQIDVSYVSSCRRGSTDSSGYSILQQIPAVHVWLWTSSPYIRPGEKKEKKKKKNAAKSCYFCSASVLQQTYKGGNIMHTDTSARKSLF